MPCSSGFYSPRWLFIGSVSLPITAGLCLSAHSGVALGAQEVTLSFSDSWEELLHNNFLSSSLEATEDTSKSSKKLQGNDSGSINCEISCISEFIPTFSNSQLTADAENISIKNTLATSSKLSDFKGPDFKGINTPSDSGEVNPLTAEFTLADGAIMPGVPTLLPGNGSAGIPIQWTLPQGNPGNFQTFPVSPAPASGDWMMVWIPYGNPAAPANPMVGVPGNAAISQPAYYPAWIPAAPGQAIANPGPGPVFYPAGGATGPTGAIPWPGPTAAVPQPFGVSPAYPVVPNPAVPGLAVPQLQFPGVIAQPTFGQNPVPAALPTYPGYPVPSAIGTGQALPVPTAPTVPGRTAVLPNPPAAIPIPTVNDSGVVNAPMIFAPDMATPGVINPGFSQVPTLTPSTIPAIPAIPPAEFQSQPPLPSPLAVENGRKPISEPILEAQGLAVVQDDDFSTRARLNGAAFLTPNILVGGTVDFVNGDNLTDDDGLQLTELYVAGSPPGVPGLRFRAGQLDLTSYFDRNSFAKDISRDFFNDTFQTNPALFAGANVTASRPAGLVQWAITDDVTITASAFSSDSDIADFALDGYAAEASVRAGNLIVRGTFISAEDIDFQESGERLEAFGINAEYFVPQWNVGFFGRYGTVSNDETDFDDDTFSFGLNAFDVFMDQDRLGLAYGRNLEISADDDTTPDVLELFYDFEISPDLRAGFSFQQRDSLSESFLGFRIRGNLDLLP